MIGPQRRIARELHSWLSRQANDSFDTCMKTPTLNRLSSSLRARTAEESIVIAQSVARSRGVVRVVDTTWLDRIGIPVYASARPDGLDGNLWCHAGKGFTRAEAKIGAYMEAIEYSYIEPGRNTVAWRMSTPAAIVASFRDGIVFPDFAPYMGRKARPADPIAVVDAEEIKRGLGPVEIPAETVFFPFKPQGIALYGGTTNGLASGNTLEEATVHALAEVMERDVYSFESLAKKSQFVRLESAPRKVREMADKVMRAGLIPVLRYAENEFGMAYFAGYVLEPDSGNLLAAASGHGFHPIREIAAVRALAEAVQSRLSAIHGARDDMVDIHRVSEEFGPRKTKLAGEATLRWALDERAAIDYLEIPDFEPEIQSLEDVLRLLFNALDQAGIQHVTRVVLSEPSFPFVVVKVVVPGCEMFDLESPRVGPRLLKRFQA